MTDSITMTTSTVRDLCREAGLRQAETPWTRHTIRDAPSVIIDPSGEDFPIHPEAIAREQETERQQYEAHQHLDALQDSDDDSYASYLQLPDETTILHRMGRKMYSPMVYYILSYTGLLTSYCRQTLLDAYRKEQEAIITGELTGGQTVSSTTTEIPDS